MGVNIAYVDRGRIKLHMSWLLFDNVYCLGQN